MIPCDMLATKGSEELATSTSNTMPLAQVPRETIESLNHLVDQIVMSIKDGKTESNSSSIFKRPGRRMLCNRVNSNQSNFITKVAQNIPKSS